MKYSRILPLAISGTALALATACTNPGAVGSDPYGSGTDSYQKTKTGAIIGGLVGAGTGIVVAENNTKGAIVGGVLGAAAGAGIGNILDRQEADLRRDLNNQDVQINNTGDRLIVTMPHDILFASDSSTLQPGLQTDLMTVAGNLNQYPDSKVQVIGHTDNTGGAEHNQQLSENRAFSVQNVLVQGGVVPTRIQTYGRGENQPVASNLTEDGKAQNRRVEIVILPNAA